MTEPTLTPPESAGFSTARLARIARVMQRYVDTQNVAGITTLIARRNQVVHFGKYGMADIENGTLMAYDTIFRIYSMTKPITSVAVLMLMEKGDIRLSDPVSAHIPTFATVKVLDTTPDSGGRYVDPIRPITVHDLLTHTAGLSYGSDEDVQIDALYREHVWGAFEQNQEMTLAAFVEAIAAQPLVFHPGTQFRYSVATDVLGYLVEIVSGQPFATFLQDQLFAPLEMVDTSFWVPPEKLGRFAANYGPDEIGGLKVIDAPATSRFARPTQRPSGGGGLLSTTGDYLRFAAMLLNKGELHGVRILGRKTVESMTVNRLPQGIYPVNDLAAGFGLGVNVLLDLGQSTRLGSLGNFGWSGAANTNFWVDPKEELIGILMLQYMPSGTYPIIEDFRNLTYQALVD